MDLLRHYLLSILIFLPAIGAIPVLAVRGRVAICWTATGIMSLTFAVSLLLFLCYDWHAGTSYAYAQDGGVMQMAQRPDWIAPFNFQYLVGIDGLSLPLVLLTTFIFVLSGIASWKTEKKVRRYFGLLFLLETSILGVFLSLNFCLLFLFLEFSLLLVGLLVWVWGGPRKEYAAVKFILYAALGSVALLIALIGIHYFSLQVFSGGTLDLLRLADPQFSRQFSLAMGGPFSPTSITFFLLLMVGFLMMLPVVPFHGWLADLHVEAPAPVSMIVVALMSSIGGYGILRVAFPIFPETAKALWLPVATLGVGNILYGALCAMSQNDLKRLLAYGSISQLGFVIAGFAMMTTASVSGAIFMLVAQGITGAALFFIAGILHHRLHHCDLTRLGGLATTMPAYSGLASVALFAGMGLPGLCGFVGEAMVLLGFFSAGGKGSALRAAAIQHRQMEWFLPASRGLAVVACGGLVLTACYTLRTVQRLFWGEPNSQSGILVDIKRRELVVLTPLIALMLLLGLMPWAIFFLFTSQTIAAFLKVFS